LSMQGSGSPPSKISNFLLYSASRSIPFFLFKEWLAILSG
jgi:hypothetical protein